MSAKPPPEPDPDLTAIFAGLASVDAELATWQAKINAAFAARFDARRAFNEQPSSEFAPSLLAAGAGARQEVGTEPEQRAFAFLDIFCERYLAASTAERAEMRRAFASSRATVNRVTWYLARCRRLLAADVDARWLTLALAAVSLSDRMPDYRDLYISLGKLYESALRAGIEPGDAFRHVGELSSDEPDAIRRMSTRRFLAEFERSTYFASIRREIADARAQGRRRLPTDRLRVTPPGPA